jgi:hypothetical protein
MPAPPLLPGTIVEYAVPGSRFGSFGFDNGDGPQTVPAIVLGSFPGDGAIKLFVFHFEGQFQAVVPASTALPVLYSPDETGRLEQVIAEMQGQIASLLQCVDQLTQAKISAKPAPAKTRVAAGAGYTSPEIT